MKLLTILLFALNAASFALQPFGWIGSANAFAAGLMFAQLVYGYIFALAKNSRRTLHMTPDFSLTDVTVIAENESYRFAVGLLAGRWVGFAMPGQFALKAARAFIEEGLETQHAVFLFPEISEGFHMGVPDRERAILLTGAVAQDPESSYGGVERWHVPPELRGKPADFRCAHCERIGCNGSACGEDY